MQTLSPETRHDATLPSTSDAAARLEALHADAFVALLADVFEHSPWVAQRAERHRPFAGVPALHAAMCAEVARASEAEQLALLRAHPELAGREAQQGELTAASDREQAGAGLKSLSPAEMAHISQLNASYADRHGFPFIVCVGRHTKASLFSEFERRVGNTRDAERAEAMAQVHEIARLRLDKLFPA